MPIIKPRPADEKNTTRVVLQLTVAEADRLARYATLIDESQSYVVGRLTRLLDKDLEPSQPDQKPRRNSSLKAVSAERLA
jgi:hypothetical protein